MTTAVKCQEEMSPVTGYSLLNEILYNDDELINVVDDIISTKDHIRLYNLVSLYSKGEPTRIFLPTKILKLYSSSVSQALIMCAFQKNRLIKKLPTKCIHLLTLMKIAIRNNNYVILKYVIGFEVFKVGSKNIRILDSAMIYAGGSGKIWIVRELLKHKIHPRAIEACYHKAVINGHNEVTEYMDLIGYIFT